MATSCSIKCCRWSCAARPGLLLWKLCGVLLCVVNFGIMWYYDLQNIKSWHVLSLHQSLPKTQHFIVSPCKLSFDNFIMDMNVKIEYTIQIIILGTLFKGYYWVNVPGITKSNLQTTNAHNSMLCACCVIIGVQGL